MRNWLPLLLLTLTPGLAMAKTSDWQSLFNGKDLTGWQQMGGKATYKVENGAIVGTSVPNTNSAYLTSKQHFEDFILELQIKVDDRLNSGVQFRSNSTQAFKKGAVHGYQMEIDTSDRKWSGGIFDQSRRGWLYNLSRNESCQNAFNKKEWNTYRVEAVGNSLRTWVNGVACADLLDDQSKKGFVALQVHSIGKDAAKAGLQVRFRDIRIKTKNLKKSLTKNNHEVPEISYLNNQLSKRQKSDGWKLLFDGKKTNQWHGIKSPKFPSEGWKVENGELTVLGKGGDILTNEEFSAFELELDFHITEGANSGIKYFIEPQALKEKNKAYGLEFQILDDKNHPDAKKGVNGNRTVGSLYDLIAAENLSEADSNNKRFSSTQWNRARILVDGNHVEHWLNNIKVVEYDRDSQMFRALVSYSKYHSRDNFGQWESSPIVIQDHGDKVSYRNIKIRNLGQ